MIKEYRRNKDFKTYKRRKRLKSHALHWFVFLFLILCCCLTAFAVILLKNSFLSAPVTDKPPDSYLSTDTFPNMQSNVQETVSPTDEQDSVDETTWCLILVNKWNPIPKEYEIELTELTNGQSVDKRIYPALQEMFDAARRDGVYPVVSSGYRNADEQQRLLDEKNAAYKAEGYSDEEAKIKAEAWVAIPGTSEHQLGIAVDINEDGIHSTSEDVYSWLNQNSYKFGFICRYLADKTEITGVIGEAWHYRYVGVDAAAEIYNQGICLEEYHDILSPT